MLKSEKLAISFVLKSSLTDQNAIMISLALKDKNKYITRNVTKMNLKNLDKYMKALDFSLILKSTDSNRTSALFIKCCPISQLRILRFCVCPNGPDLLNRELHPEY